MVIKMNNEEIKKVEEEIDVILDLGVDESEFDLIGNTDEEKIESEVENNVDNN